jgi:hypothetical protein
MRHRKLRHRFAVASSLCAAAMAATLALGAGPASAAITVPAFPSFGAYPAWLPANFQVSNIDHSEGSDTTLFVMQSISDLYSQAGIFPFSCQLTIAPIANQQCLQPVNNGGNNPNNTQSDTVDNFAGTEELQGVNDVGSGNGQSMLCGGLGGPVQGTPIDYSRSSKPFGVASCAGQGFGFAKDSVTAVDFQGINPALYGTPTGYNAIGSFASFDYTSGATITTPFPSAGIGDVADGWLPGDPTTCGFNGGAACTGSPLTDVTSNATAGSGLSRASSTAYRLWCQHGTATTGLSQIMDWGDLTNLGPNLEVLGVSLTASGTTATLLTNNENFPSSVAAGDAITGPDIPGGTTVTGVTAGTASTPGSITLSQGASNTATDTVHITTTAALPTGEGMPIGVPIRVIGVNGGSGTASTWNNFAKSTIGSGNCTTAPSGSGAGNLNENAASGPNPTTGQGPTGNLEIALENDANQIGDFANADWTGSAPDQATDIATSLYYMGNGAYLSNANASVSSIETSVPAGDPSSFVETQLTANGITAAVPTERANSFPAARTLWNIIRTDTVRASTAGFLNWFCDGGANGTINGNAITPMVAKGTDHINGGNFDGDLTNIINSQFDYSRLTDTSAELPAASQSTGNGVLNPNGTCEATQTVSTTAGSIASGNTTVTLAAPVPTTIQAGWPVYVPSGYSLTLPSGDKVASVSGSTITLTAAPTTSTGSVLPPTLYFPGHPPVLAVHDANS